MIKEYGMSDRLGQVYFAHEKRQQFLDIGMRETGDYSNATAEAIDEEIKTIISTEYAKALGILRGKKDILQKGAELLLEKEKIEGAEIKALMANQ
jgi:cell division protease FtsH